MDDLSFIPTVEHVHDNPVARRISKHCLRVAGAPACCVSACLALVFYPCPDVQCMQQQIDWNSVFSSLESLTIGVDYRVAISVDIGNRFAIEVNSLAAEFDFNGQSVATIDFREPVLLVPASITDVVVPIKFSVGSPYQAAELYSAYTSKNLQLKANALLKGTAAGFYSFEMSIKDHVVDMSAKIDTSLCALPRSIAHG